MKNIALSLLALLLTTTAWGQDVKVRVYCSDEALPYAYVYLNGAICSSADSTGSAYIAQAGLHSGDTISATYIGATPGFIIYDGGKECRISLAQSQLAPIVVFAGKKLRLGKDIKYVQQVNWFEDLSADFTFHDLRNQHEVTGRVMYTPIYAEPREACWILINTTTDCDTTGLLLSKHLQTFITEACVNVHFGPKSPMNRNCILFDGGQQGNLHIFNVIRSYYGAGVQFRVSVDEKKRIVQKIEMQAPRKNEIFNMTATYKTTFRGMRLYPDHIQIKIQDPKGNTLTQCTFTNMSLAPANPKKYTAK